MNMPVQPRRDAPPLAFFLQENISFARSLLETPLAS